MMIFYGLTILMVLAQQIQWSVSLKECFCVPMEKTEGNNATEPLFSQSLKILRDCEENSRITCNSLCKTLAVAAQHDPRSGQGFCMKLKKDVNNLYVSVYSKACDGNYEYTGLTFDKPVCCLNKKLIPCELEKVNQ